MREELLKRHVYLNVKQFHINKAFKYVLFSFFTNLSFPSFLSFIPLTSFLPFIPFFFLCHFLLSFFPSLPTSFFLHDCFNGRSNSFEILLENISFCTDFKSILDIFVVREGGEVEDSCGFMGFLPQKYPRPVRTGIENISGTGAGNRHGPQSARPPSCGWCRCPARCRYGDPAWLPDKCDPACRYGPPRWSAAAH